MAQSTRQERTPSNHSFTDSLLSIAKQYPLPTVFDHFLTLAIADCSRRPGTEESFYESEYQRILGLYKNLQMKKLFIYAISGLTPEMENQCHPYTGTDLLGDFFEKRIFMKGILQFLAPFQLCTRIALARPLRGSEPSPIKILDPQCRTGRMLITAYTIYHSGEEYYGVDSDPMYVKMTALNLFFHSIWNSEVLCTSKSEPKDFLFSYCISSEPLGIFTIKNKTKSKLWQLLQAAEQKKEVIQHGILSGKIEKLKLPELTLL